MGRAVRTRCVRAVRVCVCMSVCVHIIWREVSGRIYVISILAIATVGGSKCIRGQLISSKVIYVIGIRGQVWSLVKVMWGGVEG